MDPVITYKEGMNDPAETGESIAGGEPKHSPFTIATISAGFEKGDFLVREEQGARIYFDFFEEAFNYIANKGYARMDDEDERRWLDLMERIHDSVKGGMKYNTGTLLMVLQRPVSMDQVELAATVVEQPRKSSSKSSSSKGETARGGNP